MSPADLKYSESHEWVRVEGNLATIGITVFAVEHLSDLTYLSLPEVKSRLGRGERFGEIESVKAVSELFAPLSGEVVETNPGLVDQVETVAADPYGKGWMIKIKISNPAEIAQLMTAADYEKHVSSQS